jgi:pimeloyl-ACP methyl ester carboxylesterase
MAVRLSHEIIGSGEPLLVIHGLFGSRRNWLTMARRLAPRFSVVAVDARNHGGSDHAPTMSFEEMADDVLALCDQLGLAMPNVLGHSMGGKIAMLYALRHPQRTRRLLVLDVAPVSYRTGFRDFIEAMLAVPVDRIRSRQEAEEYLVKAVPQPALRQFLLHNLVREDGAFRWQLNLPALAANLDTICHFPVIPDGTTFTGPSLFLAGGRSDYLTDAHDPVIRRLFPVAVLRTIPQAGHWIHSDAPEEVQNEITRFAGTE